MEKDVDVTVGGYIHGVNEQLPTVAVAVHLKVGVLGFRDVILVVHTNADLGTNLVHNFTDAVKNLIPDGVEFRSEFF